MAKRLRGRCGYPADDPFRVTFHPNRLSEPLHVKKPSMIFLDDMGDRFDKDVKWEWRASEYLMMMQNPQHIFVTLTKQPRTFMNERIPGNWRTWPKNSWVGVSIDGVQHDLEDGLEYLKKSNARIKFISFEPLLGPVNVELDGIDWIIIGALTPYRSGKCHPQVDWVNDLISQARYRGVPIFLKENLRWPIKAQEFPKV